MVELIARYSNTYAGDPDLRRAIEVLDAPATEKRADRAESRVHKLDRRLSPALVAQIVADYESGLSSVKLMQKYGLGKGRILRLLRYRLERIEDGRLPG